MITITEYEVELINDQFGILTGDRYEFILDLEIPEDDELYSETGISARVLYLVDGDKREIIKYDLINRMDGAVLDFELEDDEIQMISDFCSNRYQDVN